MRILLVGQAAFAEEVLRGLVAAGDVVAAVVAPPDAGPKPDPLKATALERGIPVHQFRSLKTPEARAAFESADADLGVLAYVTQIVPEPLLRIPRQTSLCFHPSLLPRYRGGSAIPWQLIRGETRTGVTVFWPDAGIDTGPILLQREEAVGPDDTAGTLYYKKLYPLGVRTCVDAVGLVREGRAPRAQQDEALATYDPLLTDAHAAIDWSRPVATVHDLIRGCDPQPGAHTTYNGKMVRLFDARLQNGGNSAAAGQVTAIGGEEIAIALNGGTLSVRRMRGEGGKISATEFAKQTELRVGAQLG